MRVIIVHSDEAGCAPGCAAWISAEGRITADTPALFERAFAAMAPRKLPILIVSNGGLIESALKIGHMIRQRHLDVAVSATWLQACPKGDKTCREGALTGRLGEPHGNAAYCASACVYILAAGERRIVSYDVGVGLHEASATIVHEEIEHVPVVDPLGRRMGYRSKVLSSYSTEGAPRSGSYDRWAAYFRTMGIRGDLVALMHKATPEQVHWMTMAELDSTGLATDRFSPEAFIDALGHPTHALLEPAVPASGWIHQEASGDHWQDGTSRPAGTTSHPPAKDPPITIIQHLPVSYTALYPDWSVPPLSFAITPPVPRPIEAAAPAPPVEKARSAPAKPEPVTPDAGSPSASTTSKKMALVVAAPVQPLRHKDPPHGATVRDRPQRCTGIDTIPVAGMRLKGRIMVVFPLAPAGLVLAGVEHQLRLSADPKYFGYERVGVIVDSPAMFGTRQSVLIPHNLHAGAGDEIAFVTRHQDRQACRFIPSLATSVRGAE
ncbi:hypothetical protein [Labrys monachus]|uniref:Uncharacterized protein n=1 Tax=Labrys monachus TaxID=217067 RepID=A0ABU0F9S8_9HYPH|nr:hypothetical protein [Labrys monachus]MDQ0391186.1 hypothetical protein [Labrys monachus]